MNKTDTNIKAAVYAAVELSKKEQDQISAMISGLSSSQPVSVEYRIDTAILGGLRIEVGDLVVDTTVSRQLKRLTQQMVQQ